MSSRSLAPRWKQASYPFFVYSWWKWLPLWVYVSRQNLTSRWLYNVTFLFPQKIWTAA
jgi:hypothetical protein